MKILHCVQLTFMVIFLVFINTVTLDGQNILNSDSSLSTIPSYQSNLQLAMEMLTGSFSSHDQSIVDTSYYDVRLEMVEIWKHRSDGRWIYVEQAIAENLNKPYRQRVYKLTEQEDGSVRSRIFSVPNPQRFIGDYENHTLLALLSPDSLIAHEGCDVILIKITNTTFKGSTDEGKCVSNRSGAAYTTSEVILTDDKMISWDRGFDENGRQVWGATKGGYVFKKVKNYE